MVPTRPAATAPSFPERYIPALDGVRGLAIIVVLLHHFRVLFNPRFPIQFALIKLFDVGWCGVSLFFVLSGFLITGILLDSRTSPTYFSTFYARRFLRIFPLYYWYLALAFLGSHFVHNLSGDSDPLARVNPWWYLTYLQNYRPDTMLADPNLGHLWSLAVEEQFYLVWPLLVWLLRPAALTAVCVSLIPLSLAIRIYYAGQNLALSAFVNTFTPASLDALACGALIAMAIRHNAWRNRIARVALPLTIMSFALFCLLGWQAGGLFIYLVPIQTWGGTVLALLFSGLVFIAATSERSWVTRFFRVRALTFTGKISYGLYVLHPLVFSLLLQIISAIPVPAGLDLALNTEKLIVSLIASIVVAAGSWFYFEKPILGFKKYFQYGVNVGSVTVPVREPHLQSGFSSTDS